MLFYLTALFSGLLVVSNILGVKLFAVGEFMLPAAVIVYMATFLITDVIGEVYGKKNARRTVQAGFFTQVVVLFFIYLAIELPPAPAFTMQAEYEMILGGSFRVIVASLVSYMVSQHLDVSIFHRLKARHGVRKLWLRNNVSAGVTQFVDTGIFITIAFFGTVPFEAMAGMIAAQYVAKMVIVLFDTPIVYLLVRIARGRKREDAGYEAHMQV
ncbi:MAG TPA: queuosine precursor transporter [Candidatus Salinicoccus stercoripullorum]|uniref:Probable queuosine precursor transporter n=1 Tax=Candidatus Salinicoccus stercoripullorum TaxID=2838756 RepID=A0A9D1QII2_9STAP|nr:queuosine precursor transporter [Candidatus Salinicoccus stercoripullorum]